MSMTIKRQTDHTEMMPYYYWAYGSNLNVQQMQWRCPDCQPVGRLTLKDWALVFRGVADVIKAPGEGAKVAGALYRISARDELALDRYEGYPRLYTKQFLEVPDLGRIMFYVMTPECGRGVGLPGWSYLETIAEGYRDWRIGATHLSQALRRTRAMMTRRIAQEGATA